MPPEYGRPSASAAQRDGRADRVEEDLVEHHHRGQPAQVAGHRRAVELVDLQQGLALDRPVGGELAQPIEVTRALLVARRLGGAVLLPGRDQRDVETDVGAHQPQAAAEAEPGAEAQVAEQRPGLVVVRVGAVHAVGDVADAGRVDVDRDLVAARAARVELVLEGAVLVVLVAVLDPERARLPEEPRVKADRLGRQLLSARRAHLAAPGAGHRGAERLLCLGPAELGVVVAADDLDPVAARQETGQRPEHLGVALGDRGDRERGELGGAVEAVRQLVRRGGLREPGELRVLGADRHREEVDEVAVDHQSPGKATFAPPRVVANEGDELALDDIDVQARGLGGDRAQILAEVEIADDERVVPARTRHSGGGAVVRHWSGRGDERHLELGFARAWNDLRGEPPYCGGRLRTCASGFARSAKLPLHTRSDCNLNRISTPVAAGQQVPRLRRVRTP